MNSNNNVDQAAALILVSEEKPRHLALPRTSGFIRGQAPMPKTITTSRIETTPQLSGHSLGWRQVFGTHGFHA